MRHIEAIRVLEDHVVNLDYLSSPTPNTVSQFYADQCKAEARSIRQTIEHLKRDYGNEP
jgi:hypothetical protein